LLYSNFEAKVRIEALIFNWHNIHVLGNPSKRPTKNFETWRLNGSLLCSLLLTEGDLCPWPKTLEQLDRFGWRRCLHISCYKYRLYLHWTCRYQLPSLGLLDFYAHDPVTSSNHQKFHPTFAFLVISCNIKGDILLIPSHTIAIIISIVKFVTRLIILSSPVALRWCKSIYRRL